MYLHGAQQTQCFNTQLTYNHLTLSKTNKLLGTTFTVLCIYNVHVLNSSLLYGFIASTHSNKYYHWVPTMEGVRAFLESSTIHGLVYISTTEKKLVKTCWILVVIGGFTAAGYMIYQSFQDWHESPVKTTIETLPITKITFPKVTVCPPKNTYTDLNYDLMMTENMTLNYDTRRELSNYRVFV